MATNFIPLHQIELRNNNSKWLPFLCRSCGARRGCMEHKAQHHQDKTTACEGEELSSHQSRLTYVCIYHVISKKTCPRDVKKIWVMKCMELRGLTVKHNVYLFWMRLCSKRIVKPIRYKVPQLLRWSDWRLSLCEPRKVQKSAGKNIGSSNKYSIWIDILNASYLQYMSMMYINYII